MFNSNDSRLTSTRRVSVHKCAQ